MADKWNEQLRRKMADYQSAPPDGLWESLEAGLARKRAAAFPWRWALTGGGIAAAVAAVAALLLLVWHPGMKPETGIVAVAPDAPAVQEQIEADLPRDAEVQPEAAVPEGEADPEEAAAPVKAPVRKLPSHRSMIAVAETAPEEASADDSASLVDDLAPSDTAGTEEVPSTQEAAAEPSKEAIPDVETESAPGQAEEASPEAPQDGGVSSFPGPVTRPGTPAGRPSSPGHRRQRRVHQGFRFSAGLIAEGVAGGPVNTSFTALGIPASLNISTKAGGMIPDVSTLVRNRETQNVVSYSTSGTIGMMLNFSFTEQWAAEAGLQRTVLYSSGVSSTESASSKLDRTTVYTGYPLMAVFTPWRGKHLSVYVSAGPMLEHATSSRWSSESALGTYVLRKDSGTDRIDEWIASAGVATGVQWEFDGIGALFLQPGFRWRFPGSDAIDSYYKSRPRTFNLSGGFRFSF